MVCLILLPVFSHAQIPKIPAFEFLSRLSNVTDDEVTISPGTTESRFLPISEYRFSEYPQHLVKWKKQLHILMERTGRVYRLDPSGRDSISPIRIDSTHFYGFNGRAIAFVHHDTLFSFGGEGFWHRNGQLRYYSITGHEWEVLPLNEECPGLNFMYHYDGQTGKLYFIQTPYTDPVTSMNHIDHRIGVVDITGRSCGILGDLHDSLAGYFKMSLGTYQVNLPAMHGTLFGFNQQNIFLLNFRENQVSRLVNTDIANLFYGNSDNRFPVDLYAIGDVVHYTTARDTGFQDHTFRISKEDLRPVSFPVYMAAHRSRSTWVILGIMAILALTAFAIWRMWHERLASRPDMRMNEDGHGQAALNDLEFTQIERSLIDMLARSGKAGKSASVNEVNVVLGLARKSLEVQKKARTEAINRINHKYRVMNHVDQDLIVRVRSEEDRRYYHYVINEFAN